MNWTFDRKYNTKRFRNIIRSDSRNILIIGSVATTIPITYSIYRYAYTKGKLESGANSLYYGAVIAFGSYHLMKQLETHGLH